MNNSIELMEQTVQFENGIVQVNVERYAKCPLIISIENKCLNGPGASCQWLKHLKLVNAGDLWDKITGIPIVNAKQNLMTMLMNIDPDDMIDIYPMIYKCLNECTHFDADVYYLHNENKMLRLRISFLPRHEDSLVVCNGYIQII
jgi:hypothetical protein